MTIDPGSVAMKFAPGAVKALVKALGPSELGRLFKLLEADVRRSSAVGPGKHDVVWERVSRLRVDPTFCGCLVAFLERGDLAAEPTMRQRLGELLSFGDEQISDAAVVEIVVAGVLTSLHRVAHADRDATHVEHLITRSDLKRHVSDEFEGLAGLLAPSARDGVQSPSATRRLRVNMPLQSAYFTGRARELAALDAALTQTGRASVTHAIAGLGGVGKSQLAARYAHAHAHDFDVVAWINAEDGGIKDLAMLADQLREPDGLLTADQRAEQALGWLSSCEERWLLVLDNLASADQLAACCPSSGNGCVLVTTRDHAISQFAPVLTLDVFDELTAVECLVTRIDRPDERDAARRVATAVGRLPLALTHAGAYCAQGTSLQDYLELLQALPAGELFGRSQEVFYRQTVASTWQVSMHAAAAEARLAEDVLMMAALLAPDDIPRFLFDALIDREDPKQRIALIDAMAVLHRFSLAVVTPSALTVHRLLQRVVRDSDSARQQRMGAIALGALAAALPSDAQRPEQWPAFEQLVAHILALGDVLRDGAGNAAQLISVLNATVVYLLHAGSVQRALDASRTTCTHAERLLGSEHPETLAARANLASSYWSAGRTNDAITLEEEILADSERLLGAEHPKTLTARANLAGSYSSAGRTDDAITLEEQVLADSDRLLGAEHSRTLVARANLARSYWSARRTGDAITLQEQVLHDSERLLGAEHPNTLTVRANLAISYRATGRSSEAIILLEQVLADSEPLLTAEHPNMLTVRGNLALSYRCAGRTSELLSNVVDELA
jgi:tetratricopeptide (TPR) repeat protein